MFLLARATRLTFLVKSFDINIWTYSLSILLYCNTMRVRIWISIHYTYTYTFIYFNIFFHYEFIHSFFYQSTSTDINEKKMRRDSVDEVSEIDSIHSRYRRDTVNIHISYLTDLAEKRYNWTEAESFGNRTKALSRQPNDRNFFERRKGGRFEESR